MLFAYDEWFNENILKLNSKPNSEITAIYRGWMMNPEQYLNFYNNLLEKNIRLITSPKQYSLMHIFPNIYPYLVEDTTKIMTFPLYKDIDINTIKQNFDKFIVKDFVKSVKGSSFPSFFDNTISQEKFNSDMETFYKFRGQLLTGGICIKEYLDLKKYNGVTNEYRAFYVKNTLISLSRNSLQDDNTPEPPKALVEKYSKLNSVFYTVDFAELENNEWKIIEAGDGSVSGLSDKQDYASFFKALYYSIN
ncbi:MAG: ATP-grasp domain-containing protein [Christensenellaceae bacterium]|nr:ATP-grasp domain-containing protein [Christensenellaceae bacterium]